MNSLTAYVLGRRLNRFLKGSLIKSVREYPFLLSFSLSGAEFKFMNIFRVGVESEILFTDSPPADPANSIPIFKQAWGGKVTGAESLGIDRIILIRTEEGSGWDSANPYIFRLDFITPAAPAALFGAESEQLIAVSGAISDRDTIAPDSRPPSAPFSLLALPAEPPSSLLGGEVEIPPPPGRRLTESVEGLDPVAAEVITSHCGNDPDSVWDYLRDLSVRLREAEPEWTLYSHNNRTVVYPLSLPFDQPPLRAGGYHEVMEAHLQRTVYPDFIENLRRQARSSVIRKRKKVKRLLRNLRGDYREAERYGKYLRYGNLLTSNFNRLSKGMREVTLRDISTGEEITIPLKQKLSPQKNIKRYFKKAKKGEKGVSKITGRIRKAEKELKKISDTVERINGTAEPDQLYQYIENRKQEEDDRGEEGSGSFRKYTIEGKYTVYVGRNARENDRLTHAFASQRDIWFHARGVPGSHVILRGANRSTPPRILKKAASIAAYYSKSRYSELVPVSYTEKRYVRKPRKSAPGTARLDRESTLFVNPSIPGEKSS